MGGTLVTDGRPPLGRLRINGAFVRKRIESLRTVVIQSRRSGMPSLAGRRRDAVLLSAGHRHFAFGRSGRWSGIAQLSKLDGRWGPEKASHSIVSPINSPSLFLPPPRRSPSHTPTNPMRAASVIARRGDVHPDTDLGNARSSGGGAATSRRIAGFPWCCR